MESQILRFLEHNQLPILNIYHKEAADVKGDGVLYLSKKGEEVNVAFFSEDEIPDQKVKDLFLTKREELLEASMDSRMKIENMWIVNLPPFQPTSLPDAGVVFILIQDADFEAFFVGLPQKVSAGAKTYLQYILIADPPDNIEALYHWTVGASQHGRDYLIESSNASKNWREFCSFKSSSRYRKILISPSREDGEKILERVRNERPELRKMYDALRKNDSVGSPITYDYAEDGRFATDTLRYLNSSFEIQQIFPDIQDHNWKIVEFGGGYGGLCYTLFTFYPSLSKYTFLEVPEVNSLAMRVLHELLPDRQDRIEYANAEEQKNTDIYDLFISEYAISEMEEKWVDIHMENWLAKSKNVYLSMNLYNEEKKARYLKRLQEIFQDVREYEVFPKNVYANYVWVAQGNKNLMK